MARYSGQGYTEVAEMVLFWPAILPDDADQRLDDDFDQFADEMHDEGKLVQVVCERDGAYHLAVYVDEEIPAELQRYLVDPVEYPEINVQGCTFFGGIEFLHKHHSDLLEQVPGRCARLEIPTGLYACRVLRTDIPPAFARGWLAQRLGKRQFRKLTLQQTLQKASIIGGLGSVVLLFVAPWYVWLAAVLAVVGTFAWAGVLARGPACRQAIEAIEQYADLFPEIVVSLRSLPPEHELPLPEEHFELPVA